MVMAGGICICIYTLSKFNRYTPAYVQNFIGDISSYVGPWNKLHNMKVYIWTNQCTYFIATSQEFTNYLQDFNSKTEARAYVHVCTHIFSAQVLVQWDISTFLSMLIIQPTQ